jgi:hypothetical protein
MTNVVDFFIDAIDARFFSKDSQKDVLKQLWEQSKSGHTDSGTCQSVIQKGKRKGEACGKPCKSKFCNTHTKSDAPVSLCKVIIKSGKRKGESCDKKCVAEKDVCVLHSKDKKEKDDSKTIVEKDTEKEKVTEKQQPTEQPKEKATEKPQPKEKKTKEKKMCCVELKHGSNKGQACNKSCQKGTDACADHQPIKIKRIGEHFIIKGTNVLFDMANETAWGFIDSEQKINRGKNEEVARVCEQYNITFNYSYA